MKVLILGAKKNKFNLENSYLRAFNSKGSNVVYWIYMNIKTFLKKL